MSTDMTESVTSLAPLHPQPRPKPAAKKAASRGGTKPAEKGPTVRSRPAIPANVDTMTGRVLPGVSADVDSSVRETPPSTFLVPELEFTPYRIWTAGPGSPQEKISIDGVGGGFRPARDGAYHITNKAQEMALRRALPKSRWWTDDIDPAEAKKTGEEIPKCDYCGWTSLSFRAMNAHQNDAHGRAQS